MPLRRFFVLLLAAATFLTGANSAFATNYKAFTALANHDYAKAYKEFKKWADQGDASSQYNLAVMCKTGKGMPPNYTEAFKWYHLAAEQGHVGAQFNVAQMYLEGQGVKQDYLLAAMWADLAGMHGDAEALKLKDTIAQKITPAQRAEAEKMAREWKPATK